MAKARADWKQDPAPDGFNPKESHTILSMDPGTGNFGFTVFTAKLVNDKIRFNVQGTGLVANTIKELKVHLQKQNRYFLDEMQEVIDEYGPFSLMTAERYQTRGIKGTTIECINVMLGGLLYMADTDFRLYPAVSWKAAAKKCFDLEELYEETKGQNKTPHELDSFLIGIYRFSLAAGIKPFEQFKDEKQLDKLMFAFLESDKI